MKWFWLLTNHTILAKTAGPALWNSLPSRLKDADISYSEFRRLLKTFLFGQWGHGAVWTVLTAPFRNIRTYLLTYLMLSVWTADHMKQERESWSLKSKTVSMLWWLWRGVDINGGGNVQRNVRLPPVETKEVSSLPMCWSIHGANILVCGMLTGIVGSVHEVLIGFVSP